jgi:hypothetical protein
VRVKRKMDKLELDELLWSICCVNCHEPAGNHLPANYLDEPLTLAFLKNIFTVFRNDVGLRFLCPFNSDIDLVPTKFLAVKENE